MKLLLIVCLFIVTSFASVFADIGYTFPLTIKGIFIDAGGSLPANGHICFKLDDDKIFYVEESMPNGKQLIAFLYVSYTNQTPIKVTYETTVKDVIGCYKVYQLSSW